MLVSGLNQVVGASLPLQAFVSGKHPRLLGLQQRFLGLISLRESFSQFEDVASAQRRGRRQPFVECPFTQLFGLRMEFGNFAIDRIGKLQSVLILLPSQCLQISEADFAVEDSIATQPRGRRRFAEKTDRIEAVALRQRCRPRPERRPASVKVLAQAIRQLLEVLGMNLGLLDGKPAADERLVKECNTVLIAQAVLPELLRKGDLRFQGIVGQRCQLAMDALGVQPPRLRPKFEV